MEVYPLTRSSRRIRAWIKYTQRGHHIFVCKDRLIPIYIDRCDCAVFMSNEPVKSSLQRKNLFTPALKKIKFIYIFFQRPKIHKFGNLIKKRRKKKRKKRVYPLFYHWSSNLAKTNINSLHDSIYRNFILSSQFLESQIKIDKLHIYMQFWIDGETFRMVCTKGSCKKKFYFQWSDH